MRWVCQLFVRRTWRDLASSTWLETDTGCGFKHVFYFSWYFLIFFIAHPGGFLEGQNKSYQNQMRTIRLERAQHPGNVQWHQTRLCASKFSLTLRVRAGGSLMEGKGNIFHRAIGVVQPPTRVCFFVFQTKGRTLSVCCICPSSCRGCPQLVVRVSAGGQPHQSTEFWSFRFSYGEPLSWGVEKLMIPIWLMSRNSQHLCRESFLGGVDKLTILSNPIPILLCCCH